MKGLDATNYGGSIAPPHKTVLEKVLFSFKKHYQLYLMILPALILLIIFYYVPIYGLQLAFREYDPIKGLTGGTWVGLDYFKRFVTSFQFQELIKNTLSISVTSLVIGFPFPIMLALIFNTIRKESRKRTLQTIAYMPHFISAVALVGMVRVLLSPSTGLWGHLHVLLGLDAVNLLAEPSKFSWLYAFTNLWQNAGWNSIIYVAALSGVDVALYEAAKVDGASRFQQMIHIDIPSLVPTIVILLILNSGFLLNVGFETVFLMQTSANLAASEVISTYTYKIGIKSNQLSYSTAIGLFNNAINFVILLIVNFISRKLSDTSLF